eukprot:gene31747-36383_t
MYLSVPLYDLSLSESDVEIRFGAGNYPNLVTEKLFEEPAFAVASPAYLNSIAPLKTPLDLQHATLLRSALEPWQPWFEAAGLKDWPEPSAGLRVDDLGLLLEAVRHGYGVGLTRQHFAEELLARGEIVELFDVRLRTPPHAYYVVYERQVRERPEQAFLYARWKFATLQRFRHLPSEREVVAALKVVVPPHCVLFDEEDTRPYECDGLAAYRQLPMVVVLPENEQQVVAILTACHALQVQIVPRGAGTGLSGGAMPIADG